MQRESRLALGLSRQKRHVQLYTKFGFETFEGSSSHYPFNLTNCSEQDAGLMAEQIVEPDPNPLKNGCCVSFRRLKYDVAALDVGSHALAPRGGKCVPQIAHSHARVSSHIDRAHESNVLLHSRVPPERYVCIYRWLTIRAEPRRSRPHWRRRLQRAVRPRAGVFKQNSAARSHRAGRRPLESLCHAALVSSNALFDGLFSSFLTAIDSGRQTSPSSSG